MRLVTIALMVLIAWVQAELWFGKAGVAHAAAPGPQLPLDDQQQEGQDDRDDA